MSQGSAKQVAANNKLKIQQINIEALEHGGKSNYKNIQVNNAAHVLVFLIFPHSSSLESE